MPAARARQVLCRLADLPDNSSRGFTLDLDPPLELFIVRRADRVYAYRNSCPHTGAPLDWQAHQFLDAQGALIQCANHAALFRIEDGYCVAGPCSGSRLTALPVVVVDGDVVLSPEQGGEQAPP